MGRKKKINRVLTTTVNVSTDTLETINNLKRQGETQNECINRVLSKHNTTQELQEERDAWEKEAIEWEEQYHQLESTCISLRSRVDELEQVLREQRIRITAS